MASNAFFLGWFSWVSLLFSLPSSCAHEKKGLTHTDGGISLLTNQIVSKYFDNFQCLTYVTDDPDKFPFPSGDKVLHLINIVGDGSFDIVELLVKSFDEGCGGFVIRVEAPARYALIGTLVDAKRKTIGCRYNNQRYLFLFTQSHGNETDLSIMEHPEIHFLPNLVAVMVPPNDIKQGTNDSFVVYGPTVLDHHKHDVLGITHEVLDCWTMNGGFDLGADLYPDRTRNVMGRKFVFGLLNYSPFSLVISDKGNGTVFDGFETRIAALFADTINGTWEGLDHAELWGELFSNGSGTGVVGSIVGGRADLGFSGFYQWYCEDVDCTYPFYQSGITCLVPRPNLVSEWLTIILPFTDGTWLVLVAAYLINTFFFFFLLLFLKQVSGVDVSNTVGTSLSDSFFTMFRLQLEQIPRMSKIREPLAVYVRIMVFYYFFVAIFWQGGIASILTVPRYEKPIDDTADLVEKWPRVQWGANSNAWINSIRESTDPNLVQIVNKFMVLDDKTLALKTRTKDFGFFMEELPHGHFGFSDYINEESMMYLRLMKKKIYTAFGVFILPKGSPFSEKLDMSLLRMFDTGIIHKMEVQVKPDLVHLFKVTLDRINNKLQNMIGSSNMKQSTNIKLAVRHIRGSLYIYVTGTCLAAVVLLVEVLVSGRSPKKSVPRHR